MISMRYNLWAARSQRQMVYHVGNLGTTLERIASTSKLNRAADNPAGIGIYQRWMARMGGLTNGMENAQNGISMLQTANTALDSIYSLLNDALDLAIDAQAATLQPAQRAALDTQFQSKMSSINDLSNTTQYNTHYLLNVPDFTKEWDLTVAPQGGTFKLYKDDVEVISDPTNGYTLAGTTLTLNGTAELDYWDEIRMEYTASAATATIALGNTPDTSSSVEFRLNGAIISESATNGWQLSGDSINFNGTAVPQAGDTVRIEYRAGSAGKPIQLQIGASGYSSERMELPIATDVRVAALNLDTEVITTIGDAEDAEIAVEAAIDTITNLQSTLGQYEDSLTERITAMTKEQENVQGAINRLYDADMASEIVNQALYEAQTQAAGSALTAASTLQQTLLQLLGVTATGLLTCSDGKQSCGSTFI